jgi:hypothetical protein
MNWIIVILAARQGPPMQIKMLALVACVIPFLAILYGPPALSQPAPIWNHNGSLMSLELAGDQLRFAYVQPRPATMDPNSTTMSGATTTVSPDASTHVVRSERAHHDRGRYHPRLKRDGSSRGASPWLHCLCLAV